jgi:hypothetical protein
LRTIKEEDGLSWKEVGRILGKSDDRASDYANSLSEMPVGAFLLACREWNGRFANSVLALIGQKIAPLASDDIADTDKLCRILRLAHLISAALADSKSPGVIDADELAGFSTADLDDAERAVVALRARKGLGQ